MTIFRSALLLPLLATLTGCGSGQRTDQPVDTRDSRYAQSADAAYLAYQQGLPDQAARLYGTAMERARLIDDRPAFIDAAYNRAYCLLLTGDYDAADRDLVEALAINGRLLKAPIAPSAGLLLLRGEIARTRGDTAGAEAMIERAMSTPQASPADHYRADALRAHLAIDRKDLQTAKQTFARLAPTDIASQLPYHGVRARLFELEGHPDADMAYDDEAHFAQGAARYRQMARALADAGRMYAKREAWELAADRYFAAARSYASMNDPKAAAALAKQAADAAARTENSDLKSAIANLIHELGETP